MNRVEGPGGTGLYYFGGRGESIKTTRGHTKYFHIRRRTFHEKVHFLYCAVWDVKFLSGVAADHLQHKQSEVDYLVLSQI